MRGVYRPGAIVEAWFELLPERQVATTRALLAAVSAASPQLLAQVKWGNLVFQFNGQNVLAVAPFRRHVHLQVFEGQLMMRRFPMLEGSGPGLRHLRYRHGEEVDAELVTAIAAAAVDMAGSPPPAARRLSVVHAIVGDGDVFDLARFVTAQATPRGGHAEAVRELAAGAKRSHWMWYVFPQLRGLGLSAMAQRYGLAGLAEARAYARHPLLGARLRKCTQLVLALPAGATAEGVLGGIDAMKLRSCMTLFERADPAEPAYAQVLQRLYAGARCERTLAMLAGA